MPDLDPLDQFVLTLKARLTYNLVPPDKVNPNYAFQRAWNEGLKFTLQQIDDLHDKAKKGKLP